MLIPHDDAVPRCMFCNDVWIDDLIAHGGCAVCNNGGMADDWKPPSDPLPREKKPMQNLIKTLACVVAIGAIIIGIIAAAVHAKDALAVGDLNLAYQERLSALTVEPEHRCSDYNKSDYSYPSSIEPRIVDYQGGMFSPYTDQTVYSLRETDIEHIVATSEAHDSGLCAAEKPVRRGFGQDLLNLTLATPYVNRTLKSGKDAAEWQPPKNRCWYARRVIDIKRKWMLSIDEAERVALAAMLDECR